MDLVKNYTAVRQLFSPYSKKAGRLLPDQISVLSGNNSLGVYMKLKTGRLHKCCLNGIQNSVPAKKYCLCLQSGYQVYSYTT